MPSACEPLETSFPWSLASLQQRVCATRRELFVPATVDPRPGRVVHCPDLNACLINETRVGLDKVDCHAVHFGYAIPVNVVPVQERPEFVELVLDPSPELGARAIAYLLQHHPHLKENHAEMAATAKHDLRRKFPADSSGEEDIAAIAKQISDHAEAIYQTWKSRGLAPTEILNCHGNPNAADKFGSALSPTSSSGATKICSPVDILVQGPEIDDNLEKLVSDFVVEDKARIAASRQKSPVKNLPSSIQFALQKFEKNAQQNLNSNPVKSPQQKTRPESPTKTELTSKLSRISKKVTVKTLGAHHNEVFLETIEATMPVDLVPSRINAQPKTLTESTPTWPLKNKLLISEARKSLKVGSVDQVDGKKVEKNDPASYLDEVAREEKRLINALKTGAVIVDEFPDKTKSEELAKRNKPKIENNRSASPVLAEAKIGSVSEKIGSINVNNSTGMSIVDYAKVKYTCAQQKSEERKPTKPDFGASEQFVSATRSKFEPDQNKVKDEEEENATRDERDFVTSRWGPRVNSTRQRLEAVPHPELTTQQKQHIRAAASTATGNNPVRPFLTRGSVAERVMIFEKCPSELLLDKRGPRQPVVNNWRNNHETHNNKAQGYVRENSQPKNLPPHTTLQRHVKSNKSVHIPRFYFPRGKPALHTQVESTIARITAAFQSLPSHRASRAQFHTITKACDLPLYWKVPLFLAVGGEENGFVEVNAFLDFWKELVKTHHDAASKFLNIATRGLRESVCPEDLIPLVQDVVDTHPGLTFLKEATEFHSRYVHTVIARIFYCVNRSWSGKISLSELRRSNLLSVINVLEQEEDINQVTAYFSYEHFYVIYCKFWELDRDHDLFIDKMDLTRHNDHALSTRMIERIFSGAVTRGAKNNENCERENKMSYTEFVWFLLSEEDKNHSTAIEYWFRCMDLDGDGYLSMYELEYFYEEQLHRMEMIGIETLPFEDCLCQMLDMIHPAIPGKISLSDLKRCKMTSIFFDTFFNLEKYLDHEQRDPFASTRDHDAEGHELSDWDRFAAEEYELLVAEESGNEQSDGSLYHSANNVYSPNIDGLESDSLESGQIEDGKSQGYPNKMSSANHPKVHYDSCDSDDYAESDE